MSDTTRDPRLAAAVVWLLMIVVAIGLLVAFIGGRLYQIAYEKQQEVIHAK